MGRLLAENWLEKNNKTKQQQKEERIDTDKYQVHPHPPRNPTPLPGR